MIERVAFCDDGSADYGPDLLYRGLCNVLGPENVLLFPRFPRRHSPPGYPGGLGSNDGWGIGFDREKDFEARIVADDFGAIIVRRRSMQHLTPGTKDLISATKKGVLVDMEDHQDHRALSIEGSRAELGVACTVAFSREATVAAQITDDGMSIFAFQFCAVPELIDPTPVDFEFDVGYVWATNSPSRQTVRAWMAGLRGDGISVFDRDQLNPGSPDTHPIRSGDFDQGEPAYVPHDQYVHLMKRCKVLISCRGAGYDTVRYWEIPAMGRFMMAESPTIHVVDAFAHAEPGEGGHACYFSTDNPEKFRSDLRYWLDHDEEREDVAGAARAKLLESHTPEARAKYFLKKVEEART